MAGPTQPTPTGRTMRMGPAPPHVGRFHRYAATGLGAMMWFWLFYRAKKDGPVLLGLKHPWENH